MTGRKTLIHELLNHKRKGNIFLLQNKKIIFQNYVERITHLKVVVINSMTVICNYGWELKVLDVTSHPECFKMTFEDLSTLVDTSTRGSIIDCNNLLTSGSLLIGHLEQVLLVDLEEPPPFLQREIRRSTPLVELNRGLVPLCHDEVHAAASSPDRRLQKTRKWLEKTDWVQDKLPGRRLEVL